MKNRDFETMALCHNNDSKYSCRIYTFPNSETRTMNFITTTAYYRSCMSVAQEKETDRNQTILAFTHPNQGTEAKGKIQEFHADRSQLLS